MATDKIKKLKAAKPAPPDQPAGFSEFEAHAIQALLNGTATPHQQKGAIAWIINQGSNAHGAHYHANDRDTVFALGRAFVGQQIIGIAKLPLINLTQPPAKEN